MDSDSDHSEIELKLIVQPESFDKVRRVPAIIAARQGRARTTNLVSAYYDTPDFALWKSGITVRIRSEARRHVQTVKAERSRASGLFSRGEWEEAVSGPALDPVLLRATGLGPLADAAVVANLAPRFTTAIRRTTQILAGEGWRVELALDSGTVTAGQDRASISEIELELIEGEPKRLFALARDIVHRVPARLGILTKSDQGFALAAKTEPAPARARRVRLTPDMPVAAAFQMIARNCLQHLVANERVLRVTGDGEAIHQMRVALRRLRSALKLFSPLVAGPELSRIKQELHWLLAALGPARDADVFLTEIIAPALAPHPETAVLNDLKASWIERRDDAMAVARQDVESRRFTELLLDIGLWLEAGDWRQRHRPDETITDYAASMLRERRRKMRKAGGHHLSDLPAEHLHDLRLMAKQMRYAGDFFSALYKGKVGKSYIKALAGLQDTLGTLNDIAMAKARLAEEVGNGPERAWAAGLVAGWHAARRPALLERAERAWRQVRKAKRFWG